MEQGDEVVEELDVYFCNKEDLGAQLYLLQHPLRPDWKPYDTEEATKIQFKPESQRLEMEIPTPQDPAEMDDDKDPKEPVQYLKLSSTEVDLKTVFYAVGYKRPNAFYLTEVEGVLQLKPDLRHLDPTPDEKPEEKPKEELTQLQVKVRKRETAAEQQRRENSYAHIAKKEKLEKWKALHPVRSTSRVTQKVLEQLTTPVDKEVDMSLSKESFLSVVAPQLPKQTSAPKKPIVDSKPSHPRQIDITSALLHQLGTALDALFALESVVNLKDVRHFLRQFQDGASAVRDLAFVEDAMLHDAVLQTKNITCIRRVYLRLATGSAQLDPLRTILMEIVREKETIKRNDVVSAAKAKGVKITEKLFDTIMREICISKEGGFWMLKAGRG